MGICCNLATKGSGTIKASTCALIQLSNNSGLSARYTLLDVAGTGSFGKVWKAKCRRRARNVAIKSLEKTDDVNRGFILKEAAILEKLNHPNIVQLIEVLEDENFIHIVTEYCNAGDLYQRVKEMKRLSEKQAADWLKSAAEAVGYLHENFICHRDIKLENFLISNYNGNNLYKLSDFGLSFEFDYGVLMKSNVGTVAYAAPEIFTGSYDYSCDIWSLGVTLYVVLSGRLPFVARNNRYGVIRKILKEKLKFHDILWTFISQEAKDLLWKMLAKDPRKRIAIDEIMEDPWLKQFTKRSRRSVSEITMNNKVSENHCTLSS